MSQLTASIVTFNTDSDELRRCLDCVSPQWFDTVWVIDNSSNEETRRVCEGYSHVEYIASDNRGYGAGHNIALRQSIARRCTYHLVLNSDVYFNSSDMGVLIDYMNQHPECGMLQPRMLKADGSELYSVRMLPTPFDLIIRRFLPKVWFAQRRNRYELRDMSRDEERNVPYHQGSFMLMRVKALNEGGLFDERFFMYPEDIDLTRRINRSYTTMYVPKANVVHDHRAASYKSGRMMWIHIINMIRYFNKWGWIVDSDRRERNRRIRMNK